MLMIFIAPIHLHTNPNATHLHRNCIFSLTADNFEYDASNRVKCENRSGEGLINLTGAEVDTGEKKQRANYHTITLGTVHSVSVTVVQWLRNILFNRRTQLTKMEISKKQNAINGQEESLT